MNRLQRGLSNPLLKVIGARALTFPIVLICGFLWLRLVIGHLGTDEYAFVALIIGLQFLLGFLDFGTSANVLESAGRYRALSDVATLGRVLGAAWRTIVVGNLLILLVAFTLHLWGAWGSILGFSERSPIAGEAVLLVLAINTLVRPLSLSTALVAGLGRPAIATWSQALTGISSLGLVWVLLSLNAPSSLIAATPIAGQLVAYSVPFLISVKMVPGLLTRTLRGMWQRTQSKHRLRQLAVPMLIIQAIGPLNDQLDRLFLSHLSTVDALATYSLAAQLLSSAMSFLTVLTPQLWAEFATLRVAGGPPAAIRRSLAYIKSFWGVALLGGIAFCILSQQVSPWISDGRLHLPWALCAVLGATLSLAAVNLVLGIGLTDPQSLRMQPVLLCITTGLNLTLTVTLAAPLGALGPAVASLAAALLQLPLIALLAWRGLHRAMPDGAPGETAGVERAGPHQDA
jgi:O-antigen/teichoic acid export membrane protein